MFTDAFSRMALLLLENNKCLVYVPDSPLPEALMEPEIEEEDNEGASVEDTAPSGHLGERGIKREREEDPSQNEERKRMGVWSKGMQLPVTKKKVPQQQHKF